MKTAIYILIGLLNLGNLFSQNSFVINFKQNETISNKEGKISRFDVMYLPLIKVPDTLYYIERAGHKMWINGQELLDTLIKELGRDAIQKQKVYYGIDTLSQILYSRYLYEFEEPILYNYYLGKNIVRFMLLRSFDSPLMIKLEYNSDSVILYQKFLDNRIDRVGINLYGNILGGNFNVFTEQRLLNMHENRKVINNSVISTIDSLIYNSEIKKNIPTYNSIEGFDGAYWILEIHDESGYYYIYRWSPSEDTSIRKIASYLIDLSEIKMKIY